MASYQFRCIQCKKLFDKILSMKAENLLTAICPYCGHTGKRVFVAPNIIDNFMPWVKDSKMGVKKKKEFLKDCMWCEEPPSPEFWQDVKDKKVIKKGNQYKRVKK